MANLSQKEINPLPVIVIAVVLVAILGYVFWIRPMQMEKRAAAEWTSPEAQATRGPNRQVTPDYAEAVRKLREKEGTAGRNVTRRSE